MSKAERELSHARLLELLRYEPETGNFIRLTEQGGRGGRPGSIAGTRKDGYVQISIDARVYRAHRLAWFYMNGVWPAGEIDHEDTNRSNNRWGNLRDVPQVVNAENKRRAQSNSKTGLLGASWSSRDRRFVARIKARGKHHSLGAFETAEQAHSAYVQAKRRLHEGCTI